MLNNKVSDADMGEVSGGVIFNSQGISGADAYNYWELLDNNNGNVLGRYHTREDACIDAVRRFGGNNPRDIQEVGWDEVRRLRGQW